MEEQSTFGPHVTDPTERVIHKINIKNAIKAIANVSKRETMPYRKIKRKYNYEAAYDRTVFDIKK